MYNGMGEFLKKPIKHRTILNFIGEDENTRKLGKGSTCINAVNVFRCYIFQNMEYWKLRLYQIIYQKTTSDMILKEMSF